MSPPHESSSDDAASESAAGEEVYSFRDAPPAWSDPAPVKSITPITPRPPGAPESRMSRFWAFMGCNLLVFIASLCIMVLELTAARLVAKQVGNSLYTWTSVIGVVLAGITIGNYIGGWIADNFTPSRALPHLFLMSSILSFAVLWMDQMAAQLDRPADVAWSTWVLVHVAVVFFLPSLSLGTISPVVASLALSRSQHTGMTVGNLYAWGALGSIIGTFLTGFWLIDLFGTKAIVGMTAATLGVTAAVVASGQRAFRAAIVLTWIPLVCVLGSAAAVRVDLLTPLLDSPLVAGSGGIGSVSIDPDQPTRPAWQMQLTDLGSRLHQLGRQLGLRNDRESVYQDESNYSYIVVDEEDNEGEKVRYLQLDKLIHSYYSPADPTKLHYEYEQIYAEVTKRAATRTAETTTVGLPHFEGRAAVLARLPAEADFDADNDTLTIQGAMSAELRNDLLRASHMGDYWCALQDLHERTTKPRAGRLESVSLEQMPTGTTIPETLRSLLVYDSVSKLLTAFGPIGSEDYALLVDGAVHGEYHTAIQQLFRESQRVDTLFLGGGGFIFPRWIESRFAANSVIDVAEIDPAVHRAVQLQLGLPPDDETTVTTHIADARQFVDSVLQGNAASRNRGEVQRRYDLIYGDAFNDFSVPWHLTTVEFASKLQQILEPSGVYLANIIDIFPRTEFPGGQAGTSEIEFRGKLPEALDNGRLVVDRWVQAPRPFGSIEIRKKEKLLHDLRHVGVMSEETLNQLCDLDETHYVFHNNVLDLHEATNLRLTYQGELPQPLEPPASFGSSWRSCAPPYEFLEVMNSETGEPVLSVRGALTSARRDRLLELASDNEAFATAVNALYERSQSARPGRFLGRFVKTVAEVFSNVYVYSTLTANPAENRDTFVVVCSGQRLDLFGPDRSAGEWDGEPFAWLEHSEEKNEPVYHGQMAALIELSEGLLLEDDFAPVDNLLVPVFESQ